MTDIGNSNQDPERQPMNKPEGEYAVGYRKPPKEHQFQPGNNANPKGRKKGSRNGKLVIQEILFEPIPVREGNKVRKMSILEAIIKKTANKALTGDNKAALTIIGIAQKEGLLTPDENEAIDESLSETDKAILENLKRRLNQPDSDTGGASA
jgi:uncharacterized protein DUF5681